MDDSVFSRSRRHINVVRFTVSFVETWGVINLSKDGKQITKNSEKDIDSKMF